MHLNKQERAEHRTRKDREKRRDRRRVKQWHTLQARTLTDAELWDDIAKSDDNIEQYRNKVNRNCGMFNEDFENGKTTMRKRDNIYNSDT